MKKLITLLLLIGLSAAGQISPIKYYHFQNTLRDTLSPASLATSGSYSYVDGTVGKALSLSTASSALNGTTLPTASGFSVQFAYKPNYNFDKKVAQSIIQIGCWEIGIAWSSDRTQVQPVVSVRCNTTTLPCTQIDPSPRWNKKLEGVNMANYKTWNDTSSWKVVAVTYDNIDGTCRIYLNGRTHATFSYYFGGDAILGTVVINNISTYQYNGLIDEVAFYNAPLDERQVSANYSDFMDGNYYTATYINSVKAVVVANLDTNQYGIGYVAGTLSPAGYTKDCIEQLSTYPLPRYYPTHTLNRNFNWAQPDYLGGKAQSGTNATVVNRSYNIQKELAYNWGFGILAFQNAVAYNGVDSTFFIRWITLANENPTIPTHGITNYAFTDIYLTRQSYGGSHYVKNSAGQFVNTNGVTSTDKYFDTYTPSSIIDTLAHDGKYINNILRTKLLNKLTATIDLMNDNDEAIGVFKNGSGLLTNGSLQAAQTASGLSWDNFIGAGYVRAHQYYLDSIKACTGSPLVMYAQDGYDEFRAKWAYTRNLQSTINGDKYSTPDLYIRWNNNWRYFYSAWHGLNWINKARVQEIASGDVFYSPFVSAGWSVNVEEDVTPAQYLGILKVAAGMGAEFFFAAYFQEGQNANPKGYTWQVAYPSYVQAAYSRVYSDFLNSTSVTGDVLQQGSFYPNDSSLLFYAGDKRKSVTVRKVTGTNKWLIFSAVSGMNNMLGDVEDSASCQIRLGSDTLKFYTRPQGSCYVWDKANSIFYQLDGWHERKHPMRWNKNQFIIENELADNTTTKTSTYTVSASTYDFRNFVTSITISGTDTAKYTFKPRNNVPYYVHIRCSGTSIKLITNTGARTLACLGSMGWVSACSGVKIRLNVADTGTIQIVSLSGTTTLDKMYFTTDSTESFSTAPTCAISGATNFCTTTDITATSATSYLWTGGTTTQTKTISASGTYTVTITDNLGNTCSVSHTAVKTTVSASISGTATVCYGASTTLTASAGTAYLWSNGAATSSVSVTAATYTVTVYQGACTGTATFALSQYADIPASISGLSNVCNGSSTSLTASGGGTYLWSTGVTTSAITATAATYTVTVTVGACTKTATHVLSQYATVSPVISGSTSVCSGTTTTITSSSGNAYLWSTGATTQSIAVGQGNYTVTVTQGVCTGTDTHSVVEQASVNASISGASTVCSGQTTVMTSSLGDSYLWTGGTTTQTKTAGVGTYTVTVTQGACTGTATHVITTGSITASISGALAVCYGVSSSLTASGGGTYLWSSGSTNATITASAGTYTVTVTQGGCTATSSTTVVASAQVSPTISGLSTICSGTTTITSTAGNSYLWNTSATTQAISAGVGNYTVTVTVGGCTGTATFVVSTGSITTSISGALGVCYGGSTTITASGGTTYLWSNGNTNASITASAGNYTVTATSGACTATSSTTVYSYAQIVPVISGASAVCSGELTTITSTGSVFLWSNSATTASINAGVGTYTVTVTEGACTGSTTFAITTSASITPTISGTTTFCNATSLSVGGYDAYLWSNGTTEQSATISSSGTYTVTVTQGSCTGTATVVCTKLPAIALSLTGEDSVCDFTELEVATFDSYLWSSGETTASINADAGVYTVTVTQGGCTSTVSHTLVQKEIPVPVITADTICGTAYSYLQTTVAYDSYYWSNGSTQAIDTVSIAGIYTVTVTDNGCTASASYNVVSCTICNVTGLRAANITENGATKIRLTWVCTKQPHRYQLEITRPDGSIRYRYVAGLYNQFTFNWCSNKIYRFRVRAYSNSGSGAWSTPVNNTRCGNFIGSDLCDPCQ